MFGVRVCAASFRGKYWSYRMHVNLFIIVGVDKLRGKASGAMLWLILSNHLLVCARKEPTATYPY